MSVSPTSPDVSRKFFAALLAAAQGKKELCFAIMKSLAEEILNKEVQELGIPSKGGKKR